MWAALWACRDGRRSRDTASHGVLHRSQRFVIANLAGPLSASDARIGRHVYPTRIPWNTLDCRRRLGAVDADLLSAIADLRAAHRHPSALRLSQLSHAAHDEECGDSLP